MESAVRRLYVEKKAGFRGEAERLLQDLRENLKETRLEALRLVNCYDVQGLDDMDFQQAVRTVFSEPNTDDVYDEMLPTEAGDSRIAWAYLPASSISGPIPPRSAFSCSHKRPCPWCAAPVLRCLAGSAIWIGFGNTWSIPSTPMRSLRTSRKHWRWH